jgi:hypothetical protein
METEAMPTHEGRPEMTLYPQLTAAVAVVEMLPRFDTRGRFAAHEKATAAYADELLPALLPGQWRPTKHDSVWHLLNAMYRPLFDHATSFRRLGARGPTTWENCAVVSHPYHVLVVWS